MRSRSTACYARPGRGSTRSQGLKPPRPRALQALLEFPFPLEAPMMRVVSALLTVWLLAVGSAMLGGSNVGSPSPSDATPSEGAASNAPSPISCGDAVTAADSTIEVSWCVRGDDPPLDFVITAPAGSSTGWCSKAMYSDPVIPPRREPRSPRRSAPDRRRSAQAWKTGRDAARVCAAEIAGDASDRSPGDRRTARPRARRAP